MKKSLQYRACISFGLVMYSSLVLCSLGFAESAKERSDKLSGEIQLEDTQAKASNPKKAASESAAKFVADLSSSVKAGSGHVSIDDSGVTYLNVLYLYCLHKLGECGFILDAVLESDVLTSHGGATPGCPNMSRFWKSWIRDDMEKRGKYLIAVGNAAKVARFNSTERPKYIKCKDTVAPLVSQSPSQRYGSGSSILDAVARLQNLMKEIAEGDIDIYAVIGYRITDGAGN